MVTSSKTMSKIFLSLFFVVAINRTFVAGNKWCNVNCHVAPGPHVLCNYSPNTVSKSCGQIIQSGLTNDDKNQILNRHNSLRQKVASGQETRGSPGPQPRAVNMPNLVWDDQLAEMAQAWANQCNYKHICSHLSSRYEDQVGQNIAKAWGTHSGSTPYVSFVQSWYDEVIQFDANLVKNYQPLKKTGHYSQIVWAKTTKVGCGGMKYKSGRDETAYLVCNYSPAGNLGAVYEIAH